MAMSLQPFRYLRTLALTKCRCIIMAKEPEVTDKQDIEIEVIDDDVPPVEQHTSRDGCTRACT